MSEFLQMPAEPWPGEIRRLWPVEESRPSWPLSDSEIVDSLRSDAPVLRMNFVSSVDGAVTHEGRSGGLSDAADRRHFQLLRRVCDVVLVGAGTVRAEGYGGRLVSGESARWRVANGMGPHPVLAIVSGGLDLDPGSAVFAKAPVRPIVFTTSSGARRAAEFEGLADIVVADAGISRGSADSMASAAEPSRAGAAIAGVPPRVHGPAIVSALHERGLRSVLGEGGPHLFGALLADGVVDELFLTVSPTLEAGGAARIAAGELDASASLTLAGVLSSESTLLLRYRIG